MNVNLEKIIDEYCLFDDAFMRLCFKEKPECVEFILKIILPQIDGLKITEIKPEYEIDNLVNHSVCLDAYAVDENGSLYDIVIQRASKDASPKRLRYHGSLMDCNYLKKSKKYDTLPVRYVIFISENGYRCNGKPLRQFSNFADDDGEALGDETYFVYVNGRNKNDTALGKLMQDMSNPNPDTMNYKMLSDLVGYFKKKTKGKDDIMTTSEKIFNLGKEEGLKAGKISQLFDLTHKQIISAEIAAQQANMTEQEFCEQMKLAGYAD